jgi:hypothetical protein
LHHRECLCGETMPTRDVRNATVANWDEAYMFNCLSWLCDGAPIPMAKLANENVYTRLWH